MTTRWTPEARQRQAAAIRAWKPWERSTGPRTANGVAERLQGRLSAFAAGAGSFVACVGWGRLKACASSRGHRMCSIVLLLTRNLPNYTLARPRIVKCSFAPAPDSPNPTVLLTSLLFLSGSLRKSPASTRAGLHICAAVRPRLIALLDYRYAVLIGLLR